MTDITIVTLIGVFVLSAWTALVIALVKLKSHHSQLPCDLNQLTNETLIAFLQVQYHTSEYAVFEAVTVSRYDRVVEAYADQLYSQWLHHRKMPDVVRQFIIDVLEGRKVFNNTLIV